jgi:hypothetical protein
MISIERVEAVQFHRVMTAGRTSPLLLTCEKPDASTMEAVTKFATGEQCTPSSLCAELIASQLAADLGLPTPTPVLVTWAQDFANSLIAPSAKHVVNSSRPPAFGSTLVTNGATTWPVGRKLLDDNVRQMALAIFFFDAMIGNPDRGGMKPNILVLGDSFRLIDHEMAFQDYRVLVKPPPPWALGGLNSLVTPGAHIFATQLIKSAKELDFSFIRSAWAALSNRQIEAYENALPLEWTVDRSLAAFAVSRIKECRDRIDDCVAECRRILNVGS